MIENKKAAAYFSPWKYKIDRLSKRDTVFLYQSGVGIVATGRASGNLETAAYHGDPKHTDEEHYMTLDQFRLVSPALPASEIKEVTGTNYPFRGTMFTIDAESASALLEHIQKQPAV